MSNRIAVIAALAVAALMLTGCASTGPTGAGIESGSVLATQPAAASDLLVEHGLDGLDARELVTTLEAIPLDERPQGLTSSITANAVVLTDEHEHTAEVALPDDQVYVSVAPYQSVTHDCYFHSPTGCIGELGNTEVELTATNATTGETIVAETMTTQDNGFVGLWLPRDIEATIAVTRAGQTGTATVATAGDDVQTCITTLQLS